MRPSGVVSQVLLLRQHPWTMTTGTCRSPLGGIWNCTYIWLMVISPAPKAPPRPGVVGMVFDSPPTKKLPWLAKVKGFLESSDFLFWAMTNDARISMEPRYFIEIVLPASAILRF